MSKVITVTYCGMRGEGPTVKAAKLDATRKIEEMINEDWTPHMIVSGSWIVIVTKAPSDYGAHWGHRILKLDELSSGPVFMCTMSGKKQDAIKAGAKHLAQTVGNYTGLEQYLDSNDMKSLDDYFKFQAAYADAKAKGIDDSECYKYACEHSR